MRIAFLSDEPAEIHTLINEILLERGHTVVPGHPLQPRAPRPSPKATATRAFSCAGLGPGSPLRPTRSRVFAQHFALIRKPLLEPGFGTTPTCCACRIAASGSPPLVRFWRRGLTQNPVSRARKACGY
jgi:hypothetical protein